MTVLIDFKVSKTVSNRKQDILFFSWSSAEADRYGLRLIREIMVHLSKYKAFIADGR